MTKSYKCFVAVLLVVVALLGGCGDDSGSDGNAGTSGAGGGGTGGGGSGGGGTGGGGTGGGGTGGGGTGGAPMFTEQECITMTNTAMPSVPETCAPCLCGVETGVATCNANCWALIACAGVACGDLPEAERASCVTMSCGTEISQPGAAVGARELGAALMSCAAECGQGTGMEDAGN